MCGANPELLNADSAARTNCPTPVAAAAYPTKLTFDPLVAGAGAATGGLGLGGCLRPESGEASRRFTRDRVRSRKRDISSFARNIARREAGRAATRSSHISRNIARSSLDSAYS